MDNRENLHQLPKLQMALAAVSCALLLALMWLAAGIGPCAQAYADGAVSMQSLTYSPDSDPDYRDTYVGEISTASASASELRAISTLSSGSSTSPEHVVASFLISTFEDCKTYATLYNVKQLGITIDTFRAGYYMAMDDPRYFYVDETINYGFSIDGRTLIVEPKYLWSSKAQIMAEKTKFYEKVATALTWVDDSWSDLQKAQALHDYLVRNCMYDKDSAMGKNNWVAHTAYGALVNGSPVCQGYSAAYKLLLNQVGISCVYVVSTAQNHGWNMVKMDGSWYHVDITYDDKVYYTSDYSVYLDGGFDGAVSHAYFLKCDSTIDSDGKHSPWTCAYSSSGADLTISYYPEYKAAVSDAQVPAVGLKAQLSFTSVTYSGAEYKPEVTLLRQFADGSSEVVPASDYTVEYKNNVNAGTGLVVVSCPKHLEQPLITSFSIAQAIGITASATLKTKSCTYDGTAKKPGFKSVKVNGVSIPSSEYSVTYCSNKKVGTATAMLSFANYTGSWSVDFKINPKGTSLKSVSSGTKKLKVSWKKASGAGAVAGYQVRYSTKKSMAGAKKKRVSKSKTSKTIASVKSKKTYYVQVRTYAVVDGVTYYSSWSKAKSVRVR